MPATIMVIVLLLEVVMVAVHGDSWAAVSVMGGGDGDVETLYPKTPISLNIKEYALN